MLLKSLSLPYESSEATSFAQEYLLLHRLRHPNLVQVRGYRIYPDRTLVMAMEEAPGAPLDGLPLTPGWDLRKAEIARQILSALDALHRVAYLHADLKPEHVMVDDTGERPRVTLLDLGLATPIGQRIRKGTLRYIPPEILSGDGEWTVQSDLYLFGMVLYHLIYAEAPFVSGDSIEEHIRKRFQDGLPLESRIASLRLQHLLGSLTHKDPKRRPTDAGAAWTSLHEIRPSNDPDQADPNLTTLVHGFHGRESERDRFRDWIRALARSGDPSAATCEVGGEPGIGKSALLTQLVAVAETEGWCVLHQPVDDVVSRSAGFTVERTEPGIRLELGEKAARAAWMDGPATGTCDAVPTDGITSPTLTIDLGPLPLMPRQAMARSSVGDSLAKRITELSLGNPRLLASSCSQIEWLTDFAWTQYPEAVEDRFPERGPTPSEWIDWLRVVTDKNPAAREGLALIAMSRWWSPAVIGYTAKLRWSEVLDAVQPFFRRGLLREERFEPKLLSASWEFAAIQAAGSYAEDLLAKLAEQVHNVLAPSKLRELAELALALENWTAVRDLFEPTIVALHEDEQFDNLMALVVRTWNRLPPGMDIGTPRAWDLLITAIASFASTLRAEPPHRLVEGLPASVNGAARPLISAWIFRESGNKQASKDALGSAEFADGAPKSLAWIEAYLGAHYRRELNDTVRARVLGWLSHPRFQDPASQTKLRLMIMTHFEDEIPPQQSLDLLDGIPPGSRPEISAWDLANQGLIRAGALFHLTRYKEATGDATAALEFFGPRSRLRARANHSLRAAIAYETGDLAAARWESHRIIRMLLLNNELAVLPFAYRNLIFVHLHRGEMGLALTTLRACDSMLARLPRFQDPDTRSDWLPLYVRWMAGDPAAASEIRHRLGEGIVAPRLLATLGMDELESGATGDGRRHLKEALLRSEDPTAALELLALWLRTEVDLENRDAAVDLLVSLDEDLEGITPRIEALLRLTEAEMVWHGWVETDREIELVLLDAILDADRREMGPCLWRAHWTLARFYHDENRLTESVQQYEAAHARFRLLVEGLTPDQYEGTVARAAAGQFLREFHERVPEE
ncbi:MAG: protein kinase [Candidatus Eisenbacteria bacterium]